MDRLSVAIITYNEEQNIKDCLKSVTGLADEIVVVDSHSTDQTKEIAQAYDVRWFTHDFKGHVEQKNYALSLCEHEFVLSLDADERLSEEAFKYITKEKKKGFRGNYTFHRKNHYVTRWLKHGGWYPDEKLRLVRKSDAEWAGENPHDKLMASGNIIQSKVDILHLTYHTFHEAIDQANKFSSIAAKKAIEKGKTVNFLGHVVLYPFFTFIKKYILKVGFLDGREGFIAAITASYYRFLKYSKVFFSNKNGKK